MKKKILITILMLCCMMILTGAAQAAGDKSIPILFYHRVAIPRGSFLHNGMTVTPENFAKQMSYLQKHGYHPITFKQWYAFLQGEGDLPPKPVIITFDDGYEDNYKNAYPILKSYGFKANIFIVTGDVGTTNTWDAVKHFDAVPLMNWAQIRELDANGFEIDPHTVTHQHLSKIPLDAAKSEILQSKETLEVQLNHPVETFCYPYGDYDNNIIGLLQQMGFKGAVTTHFGFAHWDRGSYTLQRINIKRTDSLFAFACKLIDAALF